MTFRNIRPIYNQRVNDEVARWKIETGKKYRSKFMCVEDTLFMLHLALKEGARQQGVEFNLTVEDLTREIDAQELVYFLIDMSGQISPVHYHNGARN